MFLSLLEMAELQGCSEDTVGIESGTVVCETLADQTLADCIESGEPDIQTLKNEIKSLVVSNQKNNEGSKTTPPNYQQGRASLRKFSRMQHMF